jgi:hypothetical protein
MGRKPRQQISLPLSIAENPGKTRDEEVATLRQKNAELRTQLKVVQELARLTSPTALKKNISLL